MRDFASTQFRAARGTEVDSRAVLLCSILLILAVKGRTDLPGLGFAALVISLAVSALGIPWTGFLGRCLWVTPFCLCALPLLFTVPGTPVFALPGLDWQASQEGLERFFVVLAQTLLCLQIIVVASALTGPYGMLQALSGLGCPKPLVAVLQLCLRYLELPKEELSRLARAREARTGKEPGLALRARITGQMAGTLMLRSLHRAERVDMAMRSRGGLPQETFQGKWGVVEWLLILSACCAVFVSWTL